MDNFIQNIKIEDIIPSDTKAIINRTELEELVNSIKKFGVIEPLLVRPLNHKYEIVLGNKIYQAALQAGISSLPAIVKNIDDDIINEYRAISNISQDAIVLNDKENSPIINNLDSKLSYPSNNSDIINLSELNKQEYEREDIKMNNEINNNMMNNNIEPNPNNINVAQGQEPTFGGKFFPSLEDEPTNMNMGGIGQVMGQMPPQSVNQSPVEQNNLIDLTGNGISENQLNQAQNTVIQPTQELNPQPMNYGNQQMPSGLDNNLSINNQMNIPTPPISPEQATENLGNTINLDNLTSQYTETVQSDPSMNQNINIPNSVAPQEEPIPQFDMSQAIDPNPIMSPDINLNANSYAIDPEPTQFNQNMDMPNYNNQNMDINPSVSQNLNYQQPVMNTNYNENPIDNYQPPAQPEPSSNIDISPIKDTVPVVNTIKNLASSLETFGYTINITEEEQATSVKIIIEVQK